MLITKYTKKIWHKKWDKDRKNSSTGATVSAILTTSFDVQPEKPTTPWRSVYIAGACSFLQSAQFSIYFSSMWPYLRKLNPNALETQFGYIVTLYSLSQGISAPLFGYWSNRIKQVRIPLLIGFCFMMAGNTLYLSLPFFLPDNVAIVMMLARFIQGCGTGNMALLKAYVSTASTRQDRSRAIAFVSGGIAMGYLIGPAFQLTFSPLGPDGIFVLPFYRLNLYNAAALFSLKLNIIGFLFVFFFFTEKYDVLEAKVTKQLPSPSLIAVLICLGTRFVQNFAMTTIKTLGSAFSMLMFGFNKEEAVSTNAAAHLVAGVLGVTLHFFFILFNLSSWVRPRICAIVCLSAYAGLFATTYPWPFIQTKVKISVNGSDWGCFKERFEWCDNLAEVSPWLYYIFYVLVFGFAVSVMNIAVTTLYSEIIGPRRQGTLLGYFQLAGSLGRMFAPLITSHIYSDFGPKAPWTLEMAQICTVIALWIVFRKKMVPLKVEDDGNTSLSKKLLK